MAAWKWLVAGIVLTSTAWAQDPAGPRQAREPRGDLDAAPGVEFDLPRPKAAPSRVSAVTVYRGDALITREVDVPEGKGLVEVVVTPLPASTFPGSVFAEGGDGLRVLSTRYRTRAVMNDTRKDVRAKHEEIAVLEREAGLLHREIDIHRENLAFLSKLEGFSSSTMQSMTEKGRLSETAPIALANYVMDSRGIRSRAQIELELKLDKNTKALDLAKEQLSELSEGDSREEADAVIVIDKTAPAAGHVRLSYIVDFAGWVPKYRVRACGDKDPVQIEYLAEIEQISGEDWNDARLTLSTSQPTVNAALPELLPLDLAVVDKAKRTQKGQSGGEGSSDERDAQRDMEQAVAENVQQAGRDYRGEAQQAMIRTDAQTGGALLNQAAAFDQVEEILSKDDADEDVVRKPDDTRENPSVTYTLHGRFTVPSIRAPHLVEVGRFELTPEYFDKAAPVLSPRVYRLAKLTNTSDFVLLAGEASMYVGTDFVGRMRLPQVTIGEPFTASFGIDPHIQVGRRLVKKTHSIQGANQIHSYEFRIVVRNFGNTRTKLQVWDRLPRVEGESVAVSLASSAPAVSTDPLYQRTSKADNLLRWDLEVPAGTVGEKAMTILYQFKLEYARDVAINYLRSGGLKEAPIGGMGGMGGMGMGGGFRSIPAKP
jgi:hypothetical protein